ncbi:hypothetical protein BDQ17DRAFT_1413021 [Cyathus striatus]|nr:hypothetical protein BDQ17DRAFT_1413021 [Cyathus striatus]
MANLIRSAKYGSDWTLHDLKSQNISLNEIDCLTFFGLKELPQPSVDPELLANVKADTMEEDDHVLLMYYLNDAMIPDEKESGVLNFIFHLFTTIGYSAPGRIPRLQSNYPLFICHTKKTATIDACIRDVPQNSIHLIVKIEKRLDESDRENAQARLVAEAVAAFHHNNSIREKNGFPPLEEAVMPGIVMVVTAPVFFKIPVTNTLSTHNRHGTYPPEETRVNYCYPPVPRPDLLRREGMKPLDNRRVIFQCYEAFKAVIVPNLPVTTQWIDVDGCRVECAVPDAYSRAGTGAISEPLHFLSSFLGFLSFLPRTPEMGPNPNGRCLVG